MLLELTEITQKFKGADKPILNGINLQVEIGESIAFVAPSGFGKTTLLNIAGLLLEPTSGSIHFEEKQVSTKDAPELLQPGGIIWILQSPTLLSGRSTLDNVLISRLSSGREREEFVDEATEILQLVGLGHRVDYPINKLSGGEKQRVAVARALMAKPKLIVADEPTANLDRETADLIAKSLFELTKDSAVLVATHDPKVSGLAGKQFVGVGDGRFELQ